MTALLAQLIASLVTFRPKTWPSHVRTLEARRRDTPIGDSGYTPRSLCNAWFAVTPLQSALAALSAIPLDLAYDEYNRSTIADFQSVLEHFDEWEGDKEEKEAQQYNEARVTGPPIEEGVLVMLTKGSPERQTGGKLMPRADGPYLVHKLTSPHNAILANPFTKALLYEGRPQATSRMILFHFPIELLVPTGSEAQDFTNLDFEARMPLQEVSALLLGDFVAYELGDAGEETVTLGVVDGIHNEQSLVIVRCVAPSGPGPWQRKIWSLAQRDGAPDKDQVSYEKLVARCELENNRLTNASVDLLRSRGVAI